MEPKPHWWRKALAVDLSIYLIGLCLFAYLPSNTLNAVEIFVMFASVITLVGVIGHASVRISIPGEQWSYLATGVLGLITFGAYESYEYYYNLSDHISITYGVFLLAGAASGYAAHVIDGGHRIPPRKDRRKNV